MFISRDFNTSYTRHLFPPFSAEEALLENAVLQQSFTSPASACAWGWSK
jgi:hypothetical protein